MDATILKHYEQMLSQLRLADLQKILTSVNFSAVGRKQDLLARITELLRQNFDIIGKSIKEAYIAYITEASGGVNGLVANNLPAVYAQVNNDQRRMFQQMQLTGMQANANNLIANANAANVHQFNAVNQQMAAANALGVMPGNMLSPFMPHNLPAPMQHPNVRFKRLAFYDTLSVVMEPTALIAHGPHRVQDTIHNFRLSMQQANEITTVRDIRNAAKPDYPVQIQLRFAAIDPNAEQDDCFPPNICVKLNNKLCQLPNVIPTNRPNTDPKRPPRPVNVTTNAKLAPLSTNTLSVQWAADFTRNFCFGIFIVRKLSSEQLIERLTTKAVKPAEFTRGLIKEKLTEDADCEIATTLLKVSLNCPLGKRRMSLPCRSSCCSHLQCFDAELFLQMNERKPTWNCPVCDKPALFDTLVIDGYFQEVLASSLLKPDENEIQLNKDGSWCVPSSQDETSAADVSTEDVQNVEVIADDVEVIGDDVQPKAEIKNSPSRDKSTASGSKGGETVDLTVSDSDEDMPIAKRRTQSGHSSLTSSTQPSSSTAVNGSGQQRSAKKQASIRRFFEHVTKEASRS